MLRALRSTFATNASSHTIRAASAAATVEAPVVAHRAGQEVDRQVEARARGDELLHLLVRLAATDLGVDLDQGEVRYADPQRPPQLADDDLGHQHLRPLAGGGELDHVRPESSASTSPGSDPPSRSGVR